MVPILPGEIDAVFLESASQCRQHAHRQPRAFPHRILRRCGCNKDACFVQPRLTVRQVFDGTSTNLCLAEDTSPQEVAHSHGILGA